MRAPVSSASVNSKIQTGGGTTNSKLADGGVRVKTASNTKSRHNAATIWRGVKRTWFAILTPTMIAYLFWHVPRAGVDEAQYAAKLARFQEELEQVGGSVSGLDADPAAFRVDDVAWINAGRTVYVDLYLMSDSSKMDVLNGAAVKDGMAAAHGEIAALYGSGAGSLYGVRTGTVDPVQAKHAYWFSKPAGMSYAELDLALAPSVDLGAAVLRRMMVLGPSPEFCLLSPVALTLPAAIAGAVYRPLTAL